MEGGVGLTARMADEGASGTGGFGFVGREDTGPSIIPEGRTPFTPKD